MSLMIARAQRRTADAGRRARSVCLEGQTDSGAGTEFHENRRVNPGLARGVKNVGRSLRSLPFVGVALHRTCVDDGKGDKILSASPIVFDRGWNRRWCGHKRRLRCARTVGAMTRPRGMRRVRVRWHRFGMRVARAANSDVITATRAGGDRHGQEESQDRHGNPRVSAMTESGNHVLIPFSELPARFSSSRIAARNSRNRGLVRKRGRSRQTSISRSRRPGRGVIMAIRSLM